MWVFIIGIVILGFVAAVAGYFRNKSLERQLQRGEITEIPEPTELDGGCCGAHEVCEKESLLAAVSQKIEYYDDEELDTYHGIYSDEYSLEQIAHFSDILYSLKEDEVAGWLRSLQLREIEFPDALKDEALLIVGERRLHTQQNFLNKEEK